MNVKALGFRLGMAALFGVTIWASAGSQAAAQAPDEASRRVRSDRSVDPAAEVLVTAAPRPGATSVSLASEVTVPRTQEPGPEQRRKVLESYGRLPLSFTENQGQADERIAYYVKSPGRTLYFTKDGHTLRLTQSKGDEAKAHTIKVELVGAAAGRIEGLEHAPGIASYFKGPKEQWKTAIPTHARIGYVQPWPGIDLAYDGHGGKLESIYTVSPHADPAQIKLRYSGQDSLRLDEHGNLVYTTSLGEITETAPVLYQEIEGRRIPVEGRFVLLDEATIGFDVAHYNPDHALVIDPTLAYAGYIGGSGNDYGTGIAVDSAGNAYVIGWTDSTETSFPVTVGPDLTFSGYYDAFVAKVNPAGTALVYAGYIGGSTDTYGYGIAVDSAGNAYVTGGTASDQASFPVTVGPGLTKSNGYDAFVAKVNAAGTALVYCGYIGGFSTDFGYGIAVDSAGSAYVTGYTSSDQVSFPVTVGPGLTFNGSVDAFVAKVNPAGTALVYAGYIGGSGQDVGYGIAVDSAGNAYVTGLTESTELTFPVTIGPGLTFNGSFDAFVAKVNPAGTALVYAGYIGGSGFDAGLGIAVDSSGNAYVTGYTDSSEATFPVLGGPDLTFNGGTDAFVAKVNPAGTALVYAGYIGGSGSDVGYGIAVDSSGNAYVTGVTDSSEATFPVLGGPGLTFNGYTDAFVAKVNPAGTALVYAGYIGGSGFDTGFGIAVDSSGNAYVTGSTNSTEATFPVLRGPDLTFNGNWYDAFVAKLKATDLQGSLAVGSAPAVGTTVKLKNQYTTTDATGVYQFDPVASGSYNITIGPFVVGALTTVSGNLALKGAPSVGTNVKLKNRETDIVRVTTTDASGNFSFAGAVPGTHTITISTVIVP
jgi:carboxypeptidase family protein/beta-propeller repeat-containing protein